MTSVLERLAAEYPLLYLNPDTDTPEALAEPVCAALEKLEAVVAANKGAEPFALIDDLMQAASIGA